MAFRFLSLKLDANILDTYKLHLRCACEVGNWTEWNPARKWGQNRSMDLVQPITENNTIVAFQRDVKSASGLCLLLPSGKCCEFLLCKTHLKVSHLDFVGGGSGGEPLYFSFPPYWPDFGWCHGTLAPMVNASLTGTGSVIEQRMIILFIAQTLSHWLPSLFMFARFVQLPDPGLTKITSPTSCLSICFWPKRNTLTNLW